MRDSTWRDGVVALTKSAQVNGVDPITYASHLSATLSSAGVPTPSVDVADILVSHICWSNNVPLAWKFLDKAMSLTIVPPSLVLALLSTRVVPCRRTSPVAYRLYLELAKRYAFSLPSLINSPNYVKIIDSINRALNLSEVFGLQSRDPGVLVVEFVLSTLWYLLDASLDDEGLLELTSEKMSRWPMKFDEMEIDSHGTFDEKRIEGHEAMRKMNTLMAIELIGEFFRNKLTSRILHLARRNMSKQCECCFEHLQLLSTKSSALRTSKKISPETLMQLTSDAHRLLFREGKTNSHQTFHAVMAFPGQCHDTSHSARWLPIDLFLEDIMDGSQVVATSAAETLTDLVKALQAINRTSWQDTFLGLWVSVLRLVQRVRNIELSV